MKSRNRLAILAMLSVAVLLLGLLVGCARERTSRRPPIHLNPNMDNQPRYEAQEESDFFADSSTMRQPVEGTVARGHLREDNVFFRGKKDNGDFVEENLVGITTQLLNRGQERYDIYCAPCHSRVGDGRGIMVNRGYVPPPSFHSDRIRNLPDGEIFDVITYGIRNMPGYAHQIKPRDRWAIVAYLRALQRSQHAEREDIPEAIRDTMQ